MGAFSKFWRECHAIERVVIAVSSAAIVFFGGFLFHSQNQYSALPPIFEDAPTAKLSVNAPQGKSKERVTIHVAGAVRKPGVLVMPASARVQDAIRAAGGAKENGDVSTLNLAAHLQDAEQIRVPQRGELLNEITQGNLASVSESSSGRESRSETASKNLPRRPVNLNRASVAELETLPGIGPALALRIVQYRAEHGQFRSLDDLDAVKGLGQNKLEKLKPYVTF